MKNILQHNALLRNAGRSLRLMSMRLLCAAAALLLAGNASAYDVDPERVVWTHNTSVAHPLPGAPDWFSDRNINPHECSLMVSDALKALSGEDDLAMAWNDLFRYNNERRERGEEGYIPTETVAVLIDYGNARNHYNSPEFNQTPQLVEAVVESLIHDGGVAPERIVVGDPRGFVVDAVYERIHKRWPKVKFVDSIGDHGREKAEWDKLRGVAAMAETRFLDADYIIEMSLMKGTQGPATAGWVRTLKPGSDNSSAAAAHVDLGAKCLLAIVDGIIGSDDGHGKPTRLWSGEPFNQAWPQSVIFGTDLETVDNAALSLMSTQRPVAPHHEPPLMLYRPR